MIYIDIPELLEEINKVQKEIDDKGQMLASLDETCRLQRYILND